MKKILAFLLACVMLLSFLVSCDDIGDTAGTGNGGDQSGSGESEKPEPNPASDFEYRIKDGKVTITDYVGTSTEMVIPEKIEECPVDGVDYRACINKNIEILYMPDTLVVVGEGAFANCTALREIRFSESLTHLLLDAFRGCTALEKIILPASLREIRNGAFNDCSSVKEVYIPGGITKWQPSFLGLTSLETVTLEEGITSIPEGAFSGSEVLESVTIPASVTEISTTAFAANPSLKSVIFLGNAPEIGWAAFYLVGDAGGYLGYVKKKDITFYYKKGTTGWDNPALDEYTKVEID